MTLVGEALAVGSHLEEVDVSIAVAEAEDVLLLGVLGHRLHHAVLRQQGVARGPLLLRGPLPVGLVKQQRAPWGDRGKGQRPGGGCI